MNERVNDLTSQIMNIFNEILDNMLEGFKGIADLIYIDGYGLTDFGYIVLVVVAISVIGVAFYIIRKVIK